MNRSAPSAHDLASPLVRHVIAPGVYVDVLRPYWRERPDLSPPMPGSLVSLRVAHWKDGTMSAVPAGANLGTLARFYTGARVVEALQSNEPAIVAGVQNGME